MVTLVHGMILSLVLGLFQHKHLYAAFLSGPPLCRVRSYPGVPRSRVCPGPGYTWGPVCSRHAGTPAAHVEVATKEVLARPPRLILGAIGTVRRVRSIWMGPKA